MDLDATLAYAMGFVVLAGIGGIFLTQLFWLSRHLRDLWRTWRKPEVVVGASETKVR